MKKHKNMQQKEENTLEEETFVQKIQNHNGTLTSEIEQAYKDSLLKIVLYKLTAKNRELLLLYYFEYKNYEEIATIIKVKSSGV
jgi:DNA-directed RNA polymerase specialized sigma24 family protein